MSVGTVDVADGIAIVTIETGLPKNRLNRAAEAAIASAIAALREDPAVRVLILTGAGADFGGGLDPDEAAESAVELAASAAPGVAAIAAFDRPVIAAIRGAARGRSLELALAADIRVADPAARFGFPEVGQGTIPAGGGTQRLPRIVGKPAAFELIVLGREIDAEEAHRIGLVNQIAGDPIAAARAIAGVLVTRGPIALRFAKEAVDRGLDLSLDQGLRLEADLAIILMTTADRQEGIASFKEKRSPVYRGE